MLMLLVLVRSWTGLIIPRKLHLYLIEYIYNEVINFPTQLHHSDSEWLTCTPDPTGYKVNEKTQLWSYIKVCNLYMNSYEHKFSCA